MRTDHHKKLEQLIIQEFQKKIPLVSTGELDRSYIKLFSYSSIGKIPVRKILADHDDIVVYAYNQQALTGGELERTVFLGQYPRELPYCPSIVRTVISMIEKECGISLPIERIKFHRQCNNNDIQHGDRVEVMFLTKEAADQLIKLYSNENDCPHCPHIVVAPEGFYVAGNTGKESLERALTTYNNTESNSPLPKHPLRFEESENKPTLRPTASTPSPSYYSRRQQGTQGGNGLGAMRGLNPNATPFTPKPNNTTTSPPHFKM